MAGFLLLFSVAWFGGLTVGGMVLTAEELIAMTAVFRVFAFKETDDVRVV
jgi:hypothetical protein